MDNIIVAIFEEEGEAYKAFTEVKHDLISSACKVTQLALIKRQDGRIVKCDMIDTGIDTTDDTRIGALVGSLVGLFVGPISFLLGGTVGALIGHSKDSSDAENNMSLIERVCSKLQEGEIALVALAYEENESAFNLKLSPYRVEIIRYSADVVASEIKAAKELEKKLEKEAKAELREAEKRAKKEKKAKK
ncbi:MAG: DUF1269 domain-containing protein [Candidatus Coproplasma sp.]